MDWLTPTTLWRKPSWVEELSYRLLFCFHLQAWIWEYIINNIIVPSGGILGSRPRRPEGLGYRWIDRMWAQTECHKTAFGSITSESPFVWTRLRSFEMNHIFDIFNYGPYTILETELWLSLRNWGWSMFEFSNILLSFDIEWREIAIHTIFMTKRQEPNVLTLLLNLSLKYCKRIRTLLSHKSYYSYY